MNAYAATPESFPALVLNADFRPLSYYPLSLWSWQESVKAVFLERVNIVSEYDRFVRSPSVEIRLPSVVSLKTYVKPALYPAFTRFNVFLRDRFSCQYCGSKDDLTFDHLIPRSRGRRAEALEHSVQAFSARPTLESYRELATDAKALGDWEELRLWALSLLGRPEPDPPGAMQHPSLRGRGCSELVRVLIWESDADAAWQAANEGGCSRDLWLKLADLRRAEHPEDALGVYRRHVEDVIAGKDKRAYAEAVRLIDETMRALYAESGQPEDFDSYVEEVRTGHKAKRNLMKLMAELEPAKQKP